MYPLLRARLRQLTRGRSAQHSGSFVSSMCKSTGRRCVAAYEKSASSAASVSSVGVPWTLPQYAPRRTPSYLTACAVTVEKRGVGESGNQRVGKMVNQEARKSETQGEVLESVTLKSAGCGLRSHSRSIG